MASQEQISRLGAAQRRVAELVQGQLSAFFGALNLSRPEQARDALLEFMPILVNQFGAVSEQIALEWYEGVRANGYLAVPATNRIPNAAIEAKIRYQAGQLWSENPASTLVGLNAAMMKYVRQPGRDAIAYNSYREGIRYARVPRGEKTCAFCLMLASRTDEWLYLSKDTAGFNLKSGEKFHDGKCDCEVIPVESEDDFPDPHARREMFEMYRESTNQVGSRSDTSSILADMRRRFPDRLTDGVYVKDDD